MKIRNNFTFTLIFNILAYVVCIGCATIPPTPTPEQTNAVKNADFGTYPKEFTVYQNKIEEKIRENLVDPWSLVLTKYSKNFVKCAHQKYSDHTKKYVNFYAYCTIFYFNRIGISIFRV